MREFFSVILFFSQALNYNISKYESTLVGILFIREYNRRPNVLIKLVISSKFLAQTSCLISNQKNSVFKQSLFHESCRTFPLAFRTCWNHQNRILGERDTIRILNTAKAMKVVQWDGQNFQRSSAPYSNKSSKIQSGVGIVTDSFQVSSYI